MFHLGYFSKGEIMFLVSKAHLDQFLTWASREYRVFVPARAGTSFHFMPYAPEGHTGFEAGGVRAIEPAKAFFFPPRACVSAGAGGEPPADNGKPVCLVGLKACDLRGLEVLDRVFLDSPTREPLYAEARKRGLIIASDCTSAIGTCFCTALGDSPYPHSGFDLNLSPLDAGYVAEIGSEKGERLVSEHAEWFTPATDGDVAAREAQRMRVEQEVREAADGIPHPAELANTVVNAYEAPFWQEFAETCVECGACNFVCPTCHCFLLHDAPGNGSSVRNRSWDACLLQDFARCAGGGNPRPKLWMRLRNRFEKKFDFFPKTTGLTACTGCGRCIAACPAQIDIRAVLRKLVDYGRRDQSIPAHPGPGT